jgi:ferredoxin-NADP reductase
LCSTPKDFTKNRFLEVAIRYTAKPSVAKWLHEHARPGDEAFIRFGGDFYYQSSTAARRILLIAGGVGISPLYSILQHAMDENRIRGRHPYGHWPISIGLLYSFKTEAEGLFKKSLETKFHKENTGLLAMLMVATREPTSNMNGRLTQEEVLNAMDILDPKQEGLEIYLCGPPPFENAILSHVQALKRPNLSIFHEKWW